MGWSRGLSGLNRSTRRVVRPAQLKGLAAGPSEEDPERPGVMAVLDQVHAAPGAQERAGAARHIKVLVRVGAADAGGGDVAGTEVIAMLKKIPAPASATRGDQRLTSSTPTRRPLVVHDGAFLAAALSALPDRGSSTVVRDGDAGRSLGRLVGIHWSSGEVSRMEDTMQAAVCTILDTRTAGACTRLAGSLERVLLGAYCVGEGAASRTGFCRFGRRSAAAGEPQAAGGVRSAGPPGEQPGGVGPVGR